VRGHDIEEFNGEFLQILKTASTVGSSPEVVVGLSRAVVPPHGVDQDESHD